MESLNSLLSDWPRETFRGFMVHFTNRKLEKLRFRFILSFIAFNTDLSQ